MYLLTLDSKRDDGAYAVTSDNGDKVLFLFEHKDDAQRYAMMLEVDNSPDITSKTMDVIEVDDKLAINTCKMHNYKYAVITPNDIVIPPKNDKI